ERHFLSFQPRWEGFLSWIWKGKSIVANTVTPILQKNKTSCPRYGQAYLFNEV
ncbi:hypothetical protein F2Q69_00061930, partial [Brassica cretica]